MNFVAFSHLRWDFVFQRPQHLLTRCAKSHRVLFCEEPIFDTDFAFWDLKTSESGVRVAVPHVPAGMSDLEIDRMLGWMVTELFQTQKIDDAVLWYYTPMAFGFTSKLKARAVIYDCMDELSAFRGAPPGLRAAEAALFRRADLVFTGGRSLFEAKRHQHPSIHCFPSSIDYTFFSSARRTKLDPENAGSELAQIPHPRLGFCGVIDERMDLNLLAAIADARPDWHLVMIGPVVKINPEELPQRPNIHYLGGKPYPQLPRYLSGWDVALLPFAQNESTRFISPTKTPEYLAAGLPVVSTPIADVVHPYGEKFLVRIASTPKEFVDAIEASLKTPRTGQQMAELDRFLGLNSWDRTWRRMDKLIREVISKPTAPGAILVPENPSGTSATNRRTFTEAAVSVNSISISMEQE